MNYDVKRHLASNKHFIASKNYLANQEKINELENSAKMNALNCANAAEFTYKKDMSYEIGILHNSGCNVGVKNHSKEFPRLFLPVMYSLLQKEIANFIITNDLPSQ